MPSTSADAPPTVGAALSFNNAIASMTDFLFSGVLVRHPELKLAYSEGQIGWIPYILERCDDVWHQHGGWTGAKELIPEPPSTYYYRQIYGCFFRDKHGIDSLDVVGVDNVTFETDYPHTDTTWPHTKEVALELMGHLPADVLYKLVRGNAIRMLSLDLDQPVGAST
jgi:predicted TIM-barrel fold metal-dependent hydrolase